MLNQIANDSVYSKEFLDVFKDTAFQALGALLQKIEAPKEAQVLLEDLAILTTYSGDDQSKLEALASASRNIAAIGGTFYGPSGTIQRGRDLNLPAENGCPGI